MGFKPRSGWVCPRCARPFAVRNQWHSCAVTTVDMHFVSCQPHVRPLFDRLVAMIERCGPVGLRPVRTRIGIQARMQFAAVMPRKGYLRGHFVLSRRPTEPFFTKVEGPYGNEYVGVFELRRPADLEPLGSVIAESYRLGS